MYIIWTLCKIVSDEGVRDLSCIEYGHCVKLFLMKVYEICHVYNIDTV